MSNDFLQNNSFTLTIQKTPNVALNLTTCSIPSIGMSHTEIGTPFSWIKEPDTKVNFSELPITFKLRENLDGYLEIFNWMMGLGFPESFQQYADLKGANEPSRKNIFSDITITILTNKNNPNLRVTFLDAFPTFLSQVDFDTMVDDAVMSDIAASFEYQRFTIEALT